MASSSFPPEIKRYIDYLREAYSREPPRSVASSWIRAPIGEQQVSLALVQSERELSYAAMDHFTRSTLRGREEDIMKPKRTLLLSQIATSEYGTPPRLVLLQGEHGVGKTHLARLLSLMWRDQLFFPDHALFLLLPLWDPCLRTAKTLNDLIHHPDPAIAPAVAQWMAERRGHGCLLFLDGYSDLPLAAQWTSIYADLMKGVALQQATVVVTSHRYPSILRESNLPGTQAFQHVEVLGFNEWDVDSYALSAFQGDEVAVRSFWSYLDANPPISSLMHLPLYCAFVVKTYLQLRGQGGEIPLLPQTLTHLHDHFVFECINEALNIQPPPPPATVVVGQRMGLLGSLPEHARDSLNRICQLAYEGLVQGSSVYQNVGDDLLRLGLMETVPTLRPDGHTHYFCHSHLQHYLASRHLALISPPRRRADLIREGSILPQMAPVLQCLAGRSREQELPPPTTPPSWFNRDQASNSTLDLEFLCSISANLLDAMHCMYEAQTPQDLSNVVKKMENNYIRPHPLSLLDCYMIGYCIVNSALRWGQLECKGCRLDERGMAKMTLPRDGANRVCFSWVVSLNLSNNPIGDPGLEHIVSAIRGIHCLETLHLESCLITSRGVEQLSEVLNTDRTLLELNLSNNSIRDIGARHLATTLRINPILCRLLLCGCSIGEEGASELARPLLSNASHLQTLEVSGNFIGPSSQLSTVMRCRVKLNEPTS